MSTENQGQSAFFFQKATKLEKRAFIIGEPFILLFKKYYSVITTFSLHEAQYFAY